VWFLVYQVIKLVRGTVAVQLVKGVALFFIIRLLADLIGLTTIKWLMDQIITYGVIAGIVIFQPEVRKGLEQLGRSTVLKKREDDANEKIIQGYEKAVAYMAKRKIGALITIERNTDLSEFINTGIHLDADITGELIINIFIPNTPLHDGAVIVKDNKISVACAYLPLTANASIPKEFGTRHRAAIGVSEVSDALTIVVSEETGGISITKNNEFLPKLSMEEFGKILREELIKVEEEAPKGFLTKLENKTKIGGRK
jgi:diadenylate cyclase